MSNWDESVDFVVVGSGGGGLCAALWMACRGLKPMVLEKQAKVGGSTALSGGVFWQPNHPLQAQAGVSDSYEDGLAYMNAVIGEAGPGSSPERKHAYLVEGPQCVQFLLDQGMAWVRSTGYSDYYDELPGGKPEGRSLTAPLFDGKQLGPWFDKLQLNPPQVPINTWEFRHFLLAGRSFKGLKTALTIVARMIKQKLTGKVYLGIGASIQSRMLKLVLDRGVDVRLESPVQELIVENDKVTGVVAKINGAQRRIQAKRGVLINAGGFSHNLELRERFGPHPASVKYTMSNPGDTGEVLMEAVRIGAATDLTDQAVWLPMSFLPGTGPVFHVQDMAKPGSLLVDASGQRFVDEACSYMELGQTLFKRNQTVKAIPAWYIRDSTCHKRYPVGGMFAMMQPKSWRESGYLKKADTLEELARLCGIDEKGLKATVDRFNRFADNGVDEDFGRGTRMYDRYFGDPKVSPNPSLGPLKKGPYYAIAIYPGDVGTCGGLVCDTQARVLREDGSVIDGLYACGNSTASVMGRSYPGAGASIGNSFVWGYVAAKHAAASEST
ncbi:MAG: FAD-dependent oxidoreductase [Pseudoxanthomonas sp.]